MKVTDANNGVSHTLYDVNGQALSTTDPTGIQTQATYDYLGRKLTSTVLERFPTASTITTSWGLPGLRPDSPSTRASSAF